MVDVPHHFRGQIRRFGLALDQLREADRVLLRRIRFRRMSAMSTFRRSSATLTVAQRTLGYHPLATILRDHPVTSTLRQNPFTW